MDWIIYISEAVVPPGSVDMADIYLSARRKNRRLRVTGHLHLETGIFLQYLEGPSQAIDDLLVSIRRDWRHRNMRTLHRGTLEERMFPEWLAFSETPGSSFVRWMGGAPDGITPEQMLEGAEVEDIIEFFDNLPRSKTLITG